MKTEVYYVIRKLNTPEGEVVGIYTDLERAKAVAKDVSKDGYYVGQWFGTYLDEETPRGKQLVDQ